MTLSLSLSQRILDVKVTDNLGTATATGGGLQIFRLSALHEEMSHPESLTESAPRRESDRERLGEIQGMNCSHH